MKNNHIGLIQCCHHNGRKVERWKAHNVHIFFSFLCKVESEAESQVQSTSDDVLHAVSIPAYETDRWKEDTCSPIDGDLAQCADKI